jgi:non-canonical (house-cleaning) NTP pyrophosphatase
LLNLSHWHQRRGAGGRVQVFGKRNSKQGAGTIGQLTGGLITRQLYYEHAVIMALVPFMNSELYPDHTLE